MTTTASIVTSLAAAAGEPIYVGTVYARDAKPAADPTYIYERRVAQRDGGLVATHITRDLAGTVQLAETAMSSGDYRLASYTLHANQLGHTGTITVQGDEVAFHVVQDGREKARVEHQRTPVVVGPTLVGYIVAHLDELRRLRVLKVRFAVLDRLETIGFALRTTSNRDGQIQIRLEPTSFLVGLVVDPTDFTLDTRTGELVRIEGMVPTKIRKGTRWKDFNARVEYRFVADRYL